MFAKVFAFCLLHLLHPVISPPQQITNPRPTTMSTDPTTTLTTTGEPDPDVREIWESHGRIIERAVEFARTTKADAVRIGELLNHRRATFPKRAPKGMGFGDWVEQHLPFGRTTAFGYMKAYENRDSFLTNPDATIRQLMGNKGTPTKRPADDHDDTDKQPLRKADEIILLTERQHKRAQQLSDYFGVELQQAQRFVRDSAPRKRAPKTEPDTVEPQLAKRTIRVPQDTDDLIHNVARTTNRSYAVVANELFEIGRKRFVRRYNLNVSE